MNRNLVSPYCEWSVKPRIKCKRRAKNMGLCTQHLKMRLEFDCLSCGSGNDESPPEHTQDCEIAYPEKAALCTQKI